MSVKKYIDFSLELFSQFNVSLGMGIEKFNFNA